MALFRRKQENAVLPEIDQYYDGEPRERTGLAWLLALVSVAIVALVLVGVFLAGRWAYREVTQDSNDEPVAVVENGESNEAEDLPSFDGRGEEAGSTSSTSTEQPSGNSSSPSPVAGESTNIPATGDDSPLPSTGPASTIAIFVAVSVVATAAHYATARVRE